MMNKIPKQLQNEKFRFVKIEKGKKAPFEKEWTNKNNYKFNDESFEKHLKNGGNYGVLCGEGNLVVLDCDKDKVKKAVENHLPNTFKVKTGGGGIHFYYICKDLNKPIRLKEEKMGDLGDVQYTGKQVVGAGSLHPSGNHYEIINNKKIAEVEAEQIRFALKDFIKTMNERVLREEKRSFKNNNLDFNLDIRDVVNTASLQNRGNEYQGSHLIHGSKTKLNFCVNPIKNVWHCFRHDTGGGPLSWIAVKEGIINCSDALPGALQGDIFKQILQIASEKYGVEIKSETKKITIEQIKNQIKKVETDDDVSDVIKLIAKAPKRFRKAMLNCLSDKTGEVFDYKYRVGDLESEVKEVQRESSKSDWEEEYEEKWEDEYIKKSKELLNSQKILNKILQGIRKGEERVIGEKEKCLFTYLHAFSSFCFEKPIHLKMTGSSSAGKNYILKNVLKTFPDWKKIDLKRISKEFVNYVNERKDFWKGRVFGISEGSGVEEAKESLKLTLSEDGEGIGIVDTEGNKISPKIIKSRAGVPAFITTTATGIEDTELNNRLDCMGITESTTLTEKIRDYEIDKDYKPWEYEESKEYKELLKIIQHIPYHFDKIKEMQVINPFSRTMSKILSTAHLNYRRNFPKIKTVLKVLAVLNQERRKKIKRNGKTYIIANLEDYVTWYCMVRDEISKIEHHLEGGEETFKERLLKIQDELPDKFTNADVYSQDMIRKIYHKGSVNSYLYRLANKGLIEQLPESFGKGKTNKYRINGLEIISSNITTSNLFYPLIEYLSYLHSELISDSGLRKKRGIKNNELLLNNNKKNTLKVYTPLISQIEIQYYLQSTEAKLYYKGNEVDKDSNITRYYLSFCNPTNKTIRELIENPDLLFDQNIDKKSKKMLLSKDNKKLVKKLNDLNIEARKVKTSEKCCNHSDKKSIIEVPDEVKKGEWVGLCIDCVIEMVKEVKKNKKYDHWSWNPMVKRCEECSKSGKILSIYDNELKKDVNLCKKCAKEMYPLIEFEGGG